MITKFLTVFYLVSMKAHWKSSSRNLPISCIYRELRFTANFFFVEILSKSFLPISVFVPIFSFLVHYSLNLKIVSAILKIFLLFTMSSTDRDYNKNIYTTSSDSLFLTLMTRTFPALISF